MKKFVIPIFILLLSLLLLFAIRGRWTSWTNDAAVQSTSDAYVTGDQSPLATRISGTVRRINLGDYASVRSGDLIAELNDDDYKASVDEATAAIDAANAQLRANANAKQAGDAAVDAARHAVSQQEAMAAAARAAIDGARAQADQASEEFRRQQRLLAADATTRQQFEGATAARDNSQAAVAAKTADLARAEAAISSTKAALAVSIQQRVQLDANDAALQAQVRAKTAARTAAQVNLSYAKIFATADGKLGRFQIHPGQLLSAGMLVVDLVQSGSWVEANFQETQLARIRVGDVADITIDAYPAKRFQAHVAEIAPASGSATALLPPDNATGNFTKVVQRVPVRLVFDNDADMALLRPGLSAHVSVHTDQLDTAATVTHGRER